MDTVPDKCRNGEHVCEYNNYRKCGKDFCVLPRCVKEDKPPAFITKQMNIPQKELERKEKGQ